MGGEGTRVQVPVGTKIVYLSKKYHIEVDTEKY